MELKISFDELLTELMQVPQFIWGTKYLHVWKSCHSTQLVPIWSNLNYHFGPNLLRHIRLTRCKASFANGKGGQDWATIHLCWVENRKCSKFGTQCRKVWSKILVSAILRSWGVRLRHRPNNTWFCSIKRTNRAFLPFDSIIWLRGKSKRNIRVRVQTPAATSVWKKVTCRLLLDW